LNKYNQAFYQLECADAVLDVTGPLHNRGKEISESMSMLARMRYGLFKRRYTVFDLCAGNGLTGALTAFLYPQADVVALDVRRPQRHWENIRRFRYLEADVRGIDAAFLRDLCSDKAILAAVHPCTDLAESVIDLFNASDFAEWLFLMPCCVGDIDVQTVPPLIGECLGTYTSWTYHLYHRIQAGYKTIQVDADNLSARNAVIVASRVGRRGAGLEGAG
jgi:hypothetical protein